MFSPWSWTGQPRGGLRGEGRQPACDIRVQRGARPPLGPPLLQIHKQSDKHFSEGKLLEDSAASETWSFRHLHRTRQRYLPGAVTGSIGGRQNLNTIYQRSAELQFWSLQKNFSEFEDQLVAMCQRLTCEDWTTDHGMAADLHSQSSTTLLHLSASLGLTRLTCSLLHWVAEKPGRRLSREVDALSVDSDGFTPLVRQYH